MVLEKESRQDLRAICFLHGKKSQDCSKGKGFRTARLQSSPEHMKEAWVKHFWRKIGVGRELCIVIWENALKIILCTRHTSVMKNALKKATAAEKSCSIFGGRTTARRKVPLVAFRLDRICRNPIVQAIVEKSIACFTENTVRPSDIKFLCDGCRRVALRLIDMAILEPRASIREIKRS